MTVNRLFIDANVPMYARGAEHPLKGPCFAVLSALASGQLAGVTSVEIIQEIAHRYTQIGRRQRARSMIEDFLMFVPDVLSVTPEDVRLMLDYIDRFQDLPARDLLHVAVMVNNGISEIVSADSHFDQVPLIKRIDPRSFQPRE